MLIGDGLHAQFLDFTWLHLPSYMAWQVQLHFKSGGPPIQSVKATTVQCARDGRIWVCVSLNSC